VATNGECERLRLFVALDLPQDVREALLAWRSVVVRQIPELRLVAQEALHATLCFLGSQPAERVKEIAAACETALSGASCPELGLEAGLWLPPRRPRVLGVRLDDSSGALARIQGAVSTALCNGGWYRPEKRPFLPHVTVARVPARARVRAAELPPLQSLRFRAPAVTLYRSRLQRSGARYEPLASVALNYRGRAA
jgi:RNA 2',3'-cyclic 3'-phosphodiesterase